MSDAALAVFRAWELPVWLTASIVLTGVIYVRGWIVIRRSRPQQFGIDQLGFFFAGLVVLWLSIASPMDGFADTMLTAHMIEHLMLMSVIPPLLLLGLPAVPLLRGLPRTVVKFVAAPLIRARPLRRFSHWLVTPLVGFLAMNIAFLGWHVPAAYDFALEHEFWHDVEHICFLFTSILFWHCIIRPWPTKSGRRDWDVIVYILMAESINTLLCAFLAFCGRPVYQFYFTTTNPFGMAAVEDQTLGAVIMWVLGSFAFMIPAMGITIELLSGNRRPLTRHR
jgi:cytochrome c oxidase assembly factor CtaG